jgi:hypothetical protein
MRWALQYEVGPAVGRQVCTDLLSKCHDGKQAGRHFLPAAASVAIDSNHV